MSIYNFFSECVPNCKWNTDQILDVFNIFLCRKDQKSKIETEGGLHCYKPIRFCKSKHRCQFFFSVNFKKCESKTFSVNKYSSFILNFFEDD